MITKSDYFLLIIFSLIILLLFLSSNYEMFQNDCYIPELLQKAMNEKNINEKDIYIPCSYNSCESDALKFVNQSNKKLFLIEGCDQLASKLDLWSLLKQEFGPNASFFMPETYLLENKEDINKFPEHFRINSMTNNNQMYVLKNYAQRQEGIKLSRDLNEIMNGLSKGWYLVQDYIYNPFLINKRKINMRYYLLIVCSNNKINGYIHQNGFMYYTPEYYDANDMSFKKHITTGYIDRKVYETNPLTLEDFRKYIGPNKTEIFDNNVNYLMNNVMKAVSKKICNNKDLQNNLRFQLFGCDIAPDAELNVKLMEINKGPDLGAKDERDKKTKLQVQIDIFNVLENKENKFVKIF